jgi:hypothetical protein
MPHRIVGNFESVIFPEFDNGPVIAKIDTGAYTGALHCASIKEHATEDGGKSLLFVPLKGGKIVKKDDFIIKYVRSSNGKREKRYFISTEIVIRNRKFDITLSLADRSEMKWPVLIGRRFLKNYHFLVDPGLPNRYGDQTQKL